MTEQGDDRIIHETLAGAIAGVMAELDGVKRAYAKELGYSYLSGEEIANTVRPAMARHGVVIVPIGVENVTWSTGETSRGAGYKTVAMDAIYRICHADSDETYESRFPATASDYGVADKAMYKALTLAFKNYVRQLFSIGGGDEEPAGKQGRSAADGASAAVPPQPDGAAPVCPDHNVAMRWRSGVSKKTGRPYGFYACPEKLADGTYCPQKGTAKPAAATGRSATPPPSTGGVEADASKIGIDVNQKPGDLSDTDWQRFWIEGHKLLGFRSGTEFGKFAHAVAGVDSLKQFDGTIADLWAKLVAARQNN